MTWSFLMQYHILLLTVLTTWHFSNGSTFNNKTMELHSGILANYNPDIQPSVGAILEVNLTFHLTSLNDLDEVQGVLGTVGYLMVRWVEDRIAWNPLSYAGVTSILLPSEKVWTPPLLLGNPTFKISDLNKDKALVRILYNGSVIWNLGEVFNTKCYPDIYRYPYDDQECWLAFTPWNYLETEIKLNIPYPTVKTPFYENNGEWLLKSSRSNTVVASGISVAYFYLTFTRRPQFIVVNVILPILFLSLLNCLVYIVPVQSGERISYSITVLLSFAVFMTLVSDNIPKTSAPLPLLCYYLITVFTGSSLVMISTIYNIKIFHTDPQKPVPVLFQQMVRLIRFKGCRCTWKTSPGKHTETKVEVIDLESQGFTKKYENQPNMSNKKATDKMKKFERDQKLSDSMAEEAVDWKQVSEVLDTVSLLFFVVYFIGVTVVQLLLISSSN